MTEEQARLRGWSVPIFRAVKAAGGATSVAVAMGFKTEQTPSNWYKQRSIKRQYIHGLCALGGNTVLPQEIIDDLERRAEQVAA